MVYPFGSTHHKQWILSPDSILPQQFAEDPLEEPSWIENPRPSSIPPLPDREMVL